MGKQGKGRAGGGEYHRGGFQEGVFTGTIDFLEGGGSFSARGSSQSVLVPPTDAGEQRKGFGVSILFFGFPVLFYRPVAYHIVYTPFLFVLCLVDAHGWSLGLRGRLAGLASMGFHSSRRASRSYL